MYSHNGIAAVPSRARGLVLNVNFNNIGGLIQYDLLGGLLTVATVVRNSGEIHGEDPAWGRAGNDVVDICRADRVEETRTDRRVNIVISTHDGVVEESTGRRPGRWTRGGVRPLAVLPGR